MDAQDPREWFGHVIVCGVQGLGVRVVELLQSVGVACVIVGSSGADHHLRAVQALNVPRVDGSPRNPESLWAAGLAGALCVVCLEDDDLRSLEAALLVQELAPDTRVIVRQSNPAVGRAVTHALPRGLVVDPAEKAAPTFVESVLDERIHRMRISGDDYVVREVEVTESGRLRDLFEEFAPIVVMHADGSHAVCPSRDYGVRRGDRVALVGSEPELMNLRGMPAEPIGSSPETRGTAKSSAHAWTRRVFYGANLGLKRTVTAMAGLGLVFAVILMFGYVDTALDRMDLLDAAYFSVETLTTVGYGDFAFDEQPAYLRIIAILVMITAASLMAIIYALVTDFLVSRRIARTFGLAQAVNMTDHVIVVGLGSLGISVVEQLVALDKPVVVIERSSTNRHIGRARALGVPVITQEATQQQTLLTANLPTARGVAVLTSDEYANIESGLAVRDSLGDRVGEVPIVMRVFDRRLGAMLEQRMHFHHVRSVSAVAAPWFVAAALGLKVIATFTVDQEAFIAGRLTVRAEGGLAGMSMLDLPMRARVIALTREGGLEHLPRGRTTLQAGDDAYVVGPPEDLLQLLIHNRTFASAG